MATFRSIGWLLALLPPVLIAVLLLNVRAEKRAEGDDAARRWEQAVELIRACRRAGPGPLLDWRVCEETVLEDAWRSRPAQARKPGK